MSDLPTEIPNVTIFATFCIAVQQMPHVIDPDFAAYVATSVPDSIPSSGYFAILLALQMCHEVCVCVRELSVGGNINASA